MKILKTIQKVPGGLMVVPLFLGAIVNLVFPQFLDLGGMTTATFKSGASAFIGASLMCVGSQITPLMLLAAVTNSNGGMYLGLMTNFGDENDLGAQSLLGINDGPFLTLLGLGLAGVTSFDWKSLLASVVPLIVGIILGNLDKDIRKFLQPGIMFTLPFLAFCLGTGLNLRNIVTGGAIGIVLGVLVVVLTGIFTITADKLILRRPGYAGAAICTTAGNAVAVPAIIAEASPNLAYQVESATAAVATAVIVTAILCPIVTSLMAKKFGCPKLEREALANQDVKG